MPAPGWFSPAGTPAKPKPWVSSNGKVTSQASLSRQG